MKIVAGLGNPGREYESTPHSVGFEVVESMAAAAGVAWEEKRQFKCLAARVAVGGQIVLLVKPQTFMNLSGDSVAPVLKYHNGSPEDLVVVSDDIDLPVGRIRVRVGGSAGGHNGLRSVIERLGSPGFVRVRVGVGRDGGGRGRVIGHVLGKFPAEVRSLMADRIVPAAANAVCQALSEGPDAAMNEWNGRDLAEAR